jgi:hypothetical protein
VGATANSPQVGLSSGCRAEPLDGIDASLESLGPLGEAGGRVFVVTDPGSTAGSPLADTPPARTVSDWLVDEIH